MRNHFLLTSVLALSSLTSVACGGGNYSSDDPGPPSIVNGSAPVDGGTNTAPDASLPPGCDPTATPAANACVVNETLGVFVAPPAGDGGSATAPDGTRGNPFTKIQAAIDAAKAQKKRVYACIGTYAEQIELADGVSIFADLDCNQNWSVVTGHATLKAPDSPAVTASQISSATRIDSLDMIAPDATSAGASSIALIANGSPGLTVANATIHAGKGMKGLDGVEGAQLSNGASVNGGDNANQVLADCDYVASVCGHNHAVAPPGGTNQCIGGSGAVTAGAGGSGGIGIGDAVVTSTATFIEFAGQYYQAPGILASNGNPQPANASTAAGGARGNTKVALGQNGAPGSNGTNGASASSIGIISASGYTTANGTSGTDGRPGQGGGGGAGYDYVAQASTSFPAGHAIYFSNGPGGGAGGCPGLSGTAGEGGGASIAVIAVDSPMTLTACTIQASDGGDGGKGTFGSAPEAGGVGGADDTPGVCVTCLFQPNGTNVPHLGGSGGTGGASGWSGSGAGGPSIGIAYHGAVVKTDTTPMSGIAGHGVAAMTSGARNGGPVTVPASADGSVATTAEF